MDILDVIKSDHDEAAILIEQLERLAESPAHVAEVAALVARLGATVRIHAQAEEIALYEPCRAADRAMRDLALAGYHEHELIELMLAKLETLLPDEDGELKAVLAVLEQLVEHHTQQEERGLLPRLIRHFSDEERESMALLLLSEKARLREERSTDDAPYVLDSLLA